MVLSKRERYVVIGTVVALAALAADRFALRPLLAQRDETEARRQSLLSELKRSRAVSAGRRQNAPQWQTMVHAGLQSDPAAAESQVFHAMRNWADESGVELSLQKPDRLTGKGRLREIVFQAAGSGDMKGVARLLWRIQTASIPLRLSELQLNARKEGQDDLFFQLRVSTTYLQGRPVFDSEAQTRKDAAPSSRPALSPAAAGPPGDETPSLDSYRVLWTRNIFARDRSSRPRSRPPAAMPWPAPARSSEPQMVLTGVALQTSGAVAFFEDTRAGSTLRVGVGQALGRGKVVAIAIDHVQYEREGATRKIPVGGDLSGAMVTLSAATSQPAASSREATSRPSTSSRPAEDVPGQPTPDTSGADSILERMRQRRLRELTP